jgi:hypothetical protein
MDLASVVFVKLIFESVYFFLNNPVCPAGLSKELRLRIRSTNNLHICVRIETVVMLIMMNELKRNSKIPCIYLQEDR